MKKKAQQPSADTRPFQTSISVSDTMVCEDDACIGKTADAPDTSSMATSSPSGDSAKRLRSSISIGGRPACTDEACIGKK